MLLYRAGWRGTDLSITLQITCDLGETGSLFLWNELISLTTLLSLTNVPGGANLSFLFFFHSLGLLG